ncbi:hypothetical protein ILUMI_00096 [Ignelater luminosus]|uniref:Uncharacterized protein n=1 Tax=Ignelater luminosus TaxID=2038154 RepID=A0A8K0DTA5_IGNLU|nr:hypothetical protein ILUMI_00096 [Ignelater luminosus]
MRKLPRKPVRRKSKEHTRTRSSGAPGRFKRTPYWWNDDIQAQREKCMEDRKRITSAARSEIYRNNGHLEALKDTYKRAKKHLQRLIETSKNEHWDEVIRDLNNDIWGKGYEIIMRGVASGRPYDIPDKIYP